MKPISRNAEEGEGDVKARPDTLTEKLGTDSRTKVPKKKIRKIRGER